MKRKTEIRRFDIFLSSGDWRGNMHVFSTIEKGEKPGNEENFSADINLPLDNFNTTPDEIKEEVFAKLLKTMEEVLEQLKKKEFTSTY